MPQLRPERFGPVPQGLDRYHQEFLRKIKDAVQILMGAIVSQKDTATDPESQAVTFGDLTDLMGSLDNDESDSWLIAAMDNQTAGDAAARVDDMGREIAMIPGTNDNEKRLTEIEARLAMMDANRDVSRQLADVDALININDRSDHGNSGILDEPAWDDLRINPGSFDRPVSSDPTTVLYYPNGGGLGMLAYEFEKNDYASFTIQLPHAYKQGSDIYCHIHWTPGPRGNEENGATVGWKIDYSWANINDAFGDMQTLDLSDACDGTDHKHQMTPDVVISGTDKGISSMLLCNVRRSDTGTDDTWASGSSGELPLLLEIDFHYQIDAAGSHLINAK